MKKDAKYLVKKAIPLAEGKSIKENTEITRTHGVYYMNGGLLSRAYQEDFDNLIELEETNGYKYLTKIY